MLSFECAVDSGRSDPKPFASVYAIGPTPVVFCSLLAINMVLKYKKIGQWQDFLCREHLYVILSLSAKTVLCWPIWSSTLAPATCKPLLAPTTQVRIPDPERTKGVL
jgi:Heliorhodopsin